LQVIENGPILNWRLQFPRPNWLKIRTSNKLERLNLEIRQRLNVILGQYGRNPLHFLIDDKPEILSSVQNLFSDQNEIKCYLDNLYYNQKNSGDRQFFLHSYTNFVISNLSERLLK